MKTADTEFFFSPIYPSILSSVCSSVVHLHLTKSSSIHPPNIYPLIYFYAILISIMYLYPFIHLSSIHHLPWTWLAAVFLEWQAPSTAIMKQIHCCANYCWCIRLLLSIHPLMTLPLRSTLRHADSCTHYVLGDASLATFQPRRPAKRWRILANETHQRGLQWVIDFFSSFFFLNSSLPSLNITARMRWDVNKPSH